MAILGAFDASSAFPPSKLSPNVANSSHRVAEFCQAIFATGKKLKQHKIPQKAFCIEVCMKREFELFTPPPPHFPKKRTKIYN
jgi:ribosomal protein L11